MRYSKDHVWMARAAEAASNLARTRFDRDALANELELVIRDAVEGNGDRAQSISPGNYQ